MARLILVCRFQSSARDSDRLSCTTPFLPLKTLPELLHSGSSYNGGAAQQRAQSYQQQHPAGESQKGGGTVDAQSSAQHASSNGFGHCGESSASLNQERQNRERGVSQSQRVQQASRGGFGGAAGRAGENVEAAGVVVKACQLRWPASPHKTKVHQTKVHYPADRSGPNVGHDRYVPHWKKGGRANVHDTQRTAFPGDCLPGG